MDNFSPVSMRDKRALAFHFVYAMEQLDYSVSLESVIDNFRRGFGLDIEDDSYSIQLAKGAIENREEYDAEVEPLLENWKLKRLSCCTRIILWVALWELGQKDAIPNIVLNEAIELAKAFAEKDAYKFINGILDEIVKKRGLKVVEK